MKKIILICIMIMMLTIGAVSASDNATSDDIGAPIAKIIEEDNIADADSNQEEPILMQEDASPVKSSEKLNVSYEIIVDEEFLKGSGFESDFNIELYYREFLNGNLKIYVDDKLRYDANPAVDYDSMFADSWESSEYPNSYCVLDIHFLDRLGLSYGPHKAVFKYSGDPLFNDFEETRYFNYTYLRVYVPEDENLYESTCRFCVKSYDATGDLKIVLDDKTIHYDEFTGYEYIDLENLTFGTHSYDIYFNAYGNFKPVHKHGTFNRTYEFSACFYSGDEREEIMIDEGNTLRVFLPDDANSNVSVCANNMTYLAKSISGRANVEITNLSLGENFIYITYKDEKYYERIIIKNVTVLPALHFTYDASCEIHDDANVTLIMPEDAKGTLKINVDGKDFACDLINGTASIPLDMVGIGTHDFEISYSGDYEQYFENKTYKDIAISEATPHDNKDWDMEFSFYVEHIDYEKGYYMLYVTLHGPDDLTGTRTYYIDGEKCAQYNPDDESPYDMGMGWWMVCEDLGGCYAELDNGTHTLTVSHSGDKHYIAKSKSATFTKPLVGKMVSGIIIDIAKNVTIELPEGENGTATITVNGTAQTIIVENQTTVYPLNLEEGIWDVNVTYSGNNMSKTIATKLNTSVNHFDLECEDYFYKDSTKEAYFTYYYCDDKSFLKHIDIFIDNKKYNGPFEDEDFYSEYYTSINLNKLAPGRHNIVINYRNDKNVIVQSVKKTFTILSYSYPEIELGDINSQELNEKLNEYLGLSEDTTLIMNVNLNGNINGNVAVYKTIAYYYGEFWSYIDETIIGLYDTFDLKNGKAKIVMPTNALNRTYGLKLVISLEDGNTVNQSFTTWWYPKVEHPEKMAYGQDKTLTIYVQNGSGKIGMFGNFKPMYSQIVNGKAEFSLSSLPLRDEIKVTFVYANEAVYSGLSFDTYNLKLSIADTPEKITMYYNDGTTYSLKMSKVYGKAVKKGQTVTIKIGKTTFKKKTDKNGVVKLTIPKTIKPGKYTITAIYKTAKYSKSLTVKQVLSIKTVKVKKSAKKLTLQATLKGKKALKNKVVTFKFNGKTYKAKTNNKGIAKVTIKSSVLKKLKVGKKVTYQATYLKDTVKKTVKVKK